jgi:hypothetical protein
MAHHIFQLETELQNIPEAAPKASRSFSVSEKLARYGLSALSGAEHLRSRRTEPFGALQTRWIRRDRDASKRFLG